jgi:hypothetical protein
MATPPPAYSRHLLWIDCGAGLSAGALMLTFSSWLSRLYALPWGALLALGAVNILYGSFSCSLAARSHRPLHLIQSLAIANAAWAALCWLFALTLARHASPWGLAHLIAEGAFVGALAALEWRYRDNLSTHR